MRIRVKLCAIVLCASTVATSVAWAQQVGPFVTANVGISRTNIAAGGGPSLPSEASGSGQTFGVGAGVRVMERISVAGELSLPLEPISTEQTRGGSGGACCSVLNREHRLTFWSAVVKVNAARWLAGVGGIALSRNAMDEQRTYTDQFSTTGPKPPVTTTRSVVISGAALVLGVEAPLHLRSRVAVVPALRLFRFKPTDDQYGDSSTIRLTVGFHFGS